MENNDKLRQEFFDSIAPKVKTAPVMITTNNQIKKTLLGRLGGFIMILFLLAASAFFYYYQKTNQLATQNVQQRSELAEFLKQKNQQLSPIEKIGRHIILPAAENPEVSQDKNGFLILKYPTTQITYDPVSDIVVQVENGASSSSVGQVAGSKSQNLLVEIRNGSGIAGLGNRTAQGLKVLEGVQVSEVGNAIVNNYANTIIVNLKGKDLSVLEQKFNQTAVPKVPDGEKASNADVLIILGRS